MRKVREKTGEKAGEKVGNLCGGKASALGFLKKEGRKEGINVPRGACIGTAAYNEYVDKTGLRGRILLELNRKPFEEMRWEELWDLSEKIKHMFARTPFPLGLEKELEEKIARYFGEKAVAVRSSAPGEDSAKTSFAGVHASYVNVRGADAVLRHLRLVWASLWSDSALLYRKEMGLDIFKSAMAVLIQEIVEGRVSGVAFGMNPEDASEALVEAVYGLNKGLVDGTVEPDRWVLERKSGNIKKHYHAERERGVFGTLEGTELRELPENLKESPPLTQEEVTRVFNLTLKVEALFGSREGKRKPQDVEWTIRDNTLYTLQSRPITTLVGEDRDEKRLWYLSLRRSFGNLKELRKTIEEKHIPAMQAEARGLEKEELSGLTESALAEEIERRAGIYRKWHDIYWDDFIPFAHGARLFGQVYNETVNPKDPYEFADLLSGTGMLSLERNRKLEEMAGKLRKAPDLLQKAKKLTPDSGLGKELDAFISEYGGSYSESSAAREGLVRLLVEMASRPPLSQPPASPEKKEEPDRIRKLKDNLFSRFEGEKKQFAAELLDLGRASYRLRDDDNIYLGKIEAELRRALLEWEERLKKRGLKEAELPEIEKIPNLEPIIEEITEKMVKTLKDPKYPLEWKKAQGKPEKTEEKLKPRQLLGNPSGPGTAQGSARVILQESDLYDIKAGEVLVCDAVDPNMTFIVPLCSAIVERRGGMLIHGAIIAREYGIPCVTGVPDATKLIKNGDYLAVDGYLGIVTVLERRGW
ncbi:PEP/pyruvate-binding domain-containing protein [Methanosarcina sp. Mfa9]|uniref:PEP/pyruvate-binding domain-containing protein n=1 Tax=Methanosarcina sp. Mfa9 TaxID=3439063 RepID=UPI003F835E67